MGNMQCVERTKLTNLHINSYICTMFGCCSVYLSLDKHQGGKHGLLCYHSRRNKKRYFS